MLYFCVSAARYDTCKTHQNHESCVSCERGLTIEVILYCLESWAYQWVSLFIISKSSKAVWLSEHSRMMHLFSMKKEGLLISIIPVHCNQ